MIGEHLLVITGAKVHSVIPQHAGVNSWCFHVSYILYSNEIPFNRGHASYPAHGLAFSGLAEIITHATALCHFFLWFVNSPDIHKAQDLWF